MAPRVLAHPGTRPTERKDRSVDNISVRAGDPFFYAATRRDDHDEHPHGCIDGFVYLGFEGEDQDGEPALEIERVPCRRCHGETR